MVTRDIVESRHGFRSDSEAIRLDVVSESNITVLACRMNAPSPGSSSLPAAFSTACKLAGPFEVHAVNHQTGTRHSQTFDRPFVLFGRSQPMHMRLDDPSVSKRHALLQFIEGVPYCIDLGSRMGVVWDNGNDYRGWVLPGQTLRMGAFDITLTGPGASGTTSPPPVEPVDVDPAREGNLTALSIEVHGPGGNRDHHPLERAITLIGRHPVCRLRFLNDTLASFHCAIVNTADGAWVIDFLSRPGILLNGRPTRLAPLRDGDRIEVGQASLTVHSGLGSRSSLILNGKTGVTRQQGTDDPPALLPQKMNESVMRAFAPMHEVMSEFQECFVTMARMFAAMQQEQSALMCEQMRLLQELTRELRDLRADVRRPGIAALPAASETAPPESPANGTSGKRLPTPKPPTPPDAAALTQAHDWFLERLAKLGQPKPPPSGGR